MNDIARLLRRSCGYDHVSPTVRSFQSSATNGLVLDAADEIERLRAALNRLRMKHHECDDWWYSCPKSEDGCCDDQAGTDCNCGADEHNAIIDAALEQSAPGTGES